MCKFCQFKYYWGKKRCIHFYTCIITLLFVLFVKLDLSIESNKLMHLVTSLFPDKIVGWVANKRKVRNLYKPLLMQWFCIVLFPTSSVKIVEMLLNLRYGFYPLKCFSHPKLNNLLYTYFTCVFLVLCVYIYMIWPTLPQPAENRVHNNFKTQWTLCASYSSWPCSSRWARWHHNQPKGPLMPAQQRAILTPFPLF